MKRKERPWTRLLARLVRRRERSRSGVGRTEPQAVAGIWTGSVDRIREFADAVRDAEGWDSLSRQIALLLGGAGAAVVRWDPLADAGRPLGVFGSWEGEDLERLLCEGRCEWALALPDAPVFALQSGGRVRAVRGTGALASAISVPLRVGAERIGALVCTYPAARPMTAESVAGAEFVSLCVALLCSQQDLAAVSARQAKRIARLMDDIERMSINLRGGVSRDEVGAS
ncbi:MAG: hypothetical protein PHU43_05390 [Candidatus Bipolaricaulis sp.]|nr:hypothetical protein [Candidatus Bipolaricaulis sp.]